MFNQLISMSKNKRNKINRAFKWLNYDYKLLKKKKRRTKFDEGRLYQLELLKQYFK